MTTIASDRMELPLARMRATNILEQLEPLVERAVVVGSVRRERPTVGDIEILAVPKQGMGDLFNASVADIEPIAKLFGKLGTILKSGDRYMQVQLGGRRSAPMWRGGRRRAPRRSSTWPKLDLFLCHPPAQWGPLLAIRTGPKELGTLAVTRLRQRGLRAHRGAVWATTRDLYGIVDELELVLPHRGTPTLYIEGNEYARLPMPDEEDFFRAAGLETVPPQERDSPRALQTRR